MPLRSPTTRTSSAGAGTLTGDCSTAGCSPAFFLSSSLMRGPRGRGIAASSCVGGSPQQALQLGRRPGAQGGGLQLLDLAGAVASELAVLNLVVQLEDRVDEHLGPRRA